MKKIISGLVFAFAGAANAAVLWDEGRLTATPEFRESNVDLGTLSAGVHEVKGALGIRMLWDDPWEEYTDAIRFDIAQGHKLTSVNYTFDVWDRGVYDVWVYLNIGEPDAATLAYSEVYKMRPGGLFDVTDNLISSSAEVYALEFDFYDPRFSDRDALARLDYSAAFTVSEVNVVPVPGAMWLFVTVFGMLAYRVRNK